MPRYAFRIEYDGKPFSGWQRQAEHPSVQGAIEDALRKLEPDHPGVFGAGRTDAGVHANGQVAHVDLTRDWDPFRLSEALNHHLRPAPVAIMDAARVPEDFHARFSAIGRRYCYRLLYRRAPLTLGKGLYWRIRHELDANAMREAATHLTGHHDFTTFRSSICQARSPVKTLDVLDIEAITRADGVEYRFDIRARSFLHNQVRSFVGTLEKVGTRAWPPDRVREALFACDRAACGPVAPARGLYLQSVTYPRNPFPDPAKGGRAGFTPPAP